MVNSCAAARCAARGSRVRARRVLRGDVWRGLRLWHGLDCPDDVARFVGAGLIAATGVGLSCHVTVAGRDGWREQARRAATVGERCREGMAVAAESVAWD